MSQRTRARALAAACAVGVASACSAAGFAAAAPAPLPSPSATPTPSASASPAAEIGRVFTSDRSSEALSDSSRPTFVVDQATIESFGSRTVADALTNVPGMNLSPYGAFGAQVDYGIRGTTSTETLVLQDGVPIATGSNGTVDLGSLSTAGVQRIEVVESAASTLYGSGATGGVINIITSASAPRPYLRVSGGTYDDWDVAAQAGTGSLAVSFERHTAANAYGYPAFTYSDGDITIPAGTRINAQAQQSVARLSYVAQLGDGWTARFAAGDNAIVVGVPGDLVYGPTTLATQATNRSDALLDVSHKAGASAWDLTLSGVAQKLPFIDIPDDGGEQDTYDGRAQASLRYTASGTRTDVVTGIDLSRESADLTFFPSSPPQPAIGAAQSQAAAYAQFGYDPVTGVRLIGGVRAENDSPQGSVVAPSFGAIAGLGFARLSANVSESFHVPNLVDLYYPGFSNPNLLPERLSNYDATVSFPQLEGASIGYFGRDGSNLIVLDPLTYIPYNASRISVNGLQFTLATPPLVHVRVTASLTDLYRAIDTTTGVRLPSTPTIGATLGIERPFDGGRFAFGARVHIVGSSPDVPNPTGGPPLADPYDGYTLADAYVRYRVSPNAILTVRSQNLGAAAYAPIIGYPAPGRTIQVELATR